VTDDLRAQLTEALADLGLDPGAELYTDALLPLFDAHGQACAATALRQAADAVTAWGRDGIRNAVRELRDRADALEADR
jgi:hypothetical protein